MTAASSRSAGHAELGKIGERVRQFREALGWSQEFLAERADVHDRTVSKIERGNLNFSVLVLKRLARAMGKSPNDILGR